MNIVSKISSNLLEWLMHIGLSEIENFDQIAVPHQLAEGSNDSLAVLENYGYSDYLLGS